MPEYEFVNRSEYSPVKQELEEIIRRAQKFMKEKYDTTFQYQLIGSGKRHLITRIKDGNKGYDFDYNLILPTLEEGWSYKPKVIKDQFREAFNYAVQGTKYKCPEDSTSALTIKVVDQKTKKILHSCDLAIIYYRDDEDADEGYMFLKNHKDGHYTFEIRARSRNADGKLDEILEYQNGWNWIRDEYLKLKCRNKDENKHSFDLYLESIHNVYNQIQQSEE